MAQTPISSPYPCCYCCSCCSFLLLLFFLARINELNENRHPLTRFVPSFLPLHIHVTHTPHTSVTRSHSTASRTSVEIQRQRQYQYNAVHRNILGLCSLMNKFVHSLWRALVLLSYAGRISGCRVRYLSRCV